MEEFTASSNNVRRMDDFDDGESAARERQALRRMRNEDDRRFNEDFNANFARNRFRDNRQFDRNFNADSSRDQFRDNRRFDRNFNSDYKYDRVNDYRSQYRDNRKGGFNQNRDDFGNYNNRHYYDSPNYRRYDNRNNAPFMDRNRAPRENYNEGYGPRKMQSSRFQKQFQNNPRYERRPRFEDESDDDFEDRSQNKNRFDNYDNDERENFRRSYERFPRGNASINQRNEPFLSKAPEPNEKISNPFNITLENRFQILNSVQTPLYNYSQDYQLSVLHKQATKVLSNLGKKLRGATFDIVLDEQGLPCSLNPTVASPITTVYQGVNNFSIWPGIDGNRKTVGTFIGKPGKHNDVVCIEPDQLICAKESHKKLAKLFQEYLRKVSPLDVCINFSEGGNWRNFSIRSNDEGQHMLTAVLHPQELSYDDLAAEKERLKNYFQPLAEEYKISSLYFQACPGSRCSHETAPYQLIFGDETLRDTFNGLTLEISPNAFYHANKPAAQILHNTIAEEVKLSEADVVVDLCSGIGTLSLEIAPHIEKLYGIDRSKSLVEIAKKNAALNGINNCNFFEGLVEPTLSSLQDSLFDKRVVVVAKATQEGFTSGAMSLLRSMKCVRKIVYASCDPAGKSLRNFFHLMIPERRRDNIVGLPFIAVTATPFQLFPHTDHLDLMVTFERTFK
ncbi:tRNA uracil-5-methyltransferase-like protein [Dinothrombium tinctorium]|uniref:tRNA (uracil(54)-C(5))-methyltransferase n=1 Tax=Dinothrombium tinctorium TaxID=1965070 RepID=A0A3S3S1L2_9ACAR|nr:tRNA uracil-5-methyltransferase-like protein [Dinothrombium tinctorium]RWS09131.1 tRNA uracil-5-methyltransferase-like protein [Dinothrombium tinctorium]RWS12584.1 tRNA uracil-5-methyltransferase-like protein [Dinothrombium tinctorium]